MEKLLDIKDLSVRFKLDERDLLAVRGVSLELEKGKTLGLVGESGCGKSVTAFSILNLVPHPGVIDEGEILYKGRDILKMDRDEVRKLRGKEVAMIFQEPMSSLNPVFSIGYQISESIRLHLGMNKKEAREYAVDLLNKVGIPDASKRYGSYAHEFSGGMRQRVMIAMAISTSPALLIADEPTTALDVTIQSQILDLLLRLQEENGMSLLLITHDLGIVANIADDIAIMYAGEVVETGSITNVFSKPVHPYTKGLFKSVPRTEYSGERLYTIEGTVPAISSEPDGCVFYNRCNERLNTCEHSILPLKELGVDHHVRCVLQ